MRHRWKAVATLLVAAMSACGSSNADSSDADPSDTVSSIAGSSIAVAAQTQQFPDVIDATATRSGATWTFAVTISSPYDTPDRYADAWRVVGADGTEYGVRILTHDHASEQPFTRSQSGIEIPGGVDVVTIEARDLRNGWGGTTLQLTLPSS